jgi:amino acid adenylation domain-containing protein
MQTIMDLIERSFLLHKSRVAIRIYDNLWTYNDLQDLSSHIAGFLLKSGIKRGDRVVVLMNKSIYLYATIIGIMQAGGVYVPLDTRTPSLRLARILEDIVPFYVFIDHHSARHYQGCRGLLKNQFEVLHFDDCEDGLYKRINFGEESIENKEGFPSHSSEDLALILHTSGSTGVPKGVMISHGNLYNIMSYTIKAFDYGPQEVGSALNASSFDMSMTDMFSVLCSGGTLGVYPEEIIFPKDILDLTYKYGITKMCLVPSSLSSLVNSNLIQPDLLSGLKDVFLIGELIPANTLFTIMDRLPNTRFHNWYGPAETTNYNSKHTFSKRLNRRATNFSIGFPIAGSKFILDRTGFENEKRKGELLVAGPQVGLGYWNDPEKTQIAFGVNDRGERYYRTGDIASFNPKVGYFIHGRKDHQIKFKGYRIELGEIEHILSLLPIVRENVVIPIYENGQVGKLRLIYSAEGDCEKEIRRHLIKNLPSYMIPKSMIRVEGLPKNQNNKIDRVMIKDMYGGNGHIPQK